MVIGRWATAVEVPSRETGIAPVMFLPGKLLSIGQVCSMQTSSMLYWTDPFQSRSSLHHHLHRLLLLTFSVGTNQTLLCTFHSSCQRLPADSMLVTQEVSVAKTP